MRLTEILGIFFRGLAMGAADVVPGVSGGTIAFITGIYPRLIGSLKSFDLEVLKLVLGMKIAKAWKRVDGNFLCALFAGIFSSILLFAHLISYLLQGYPTVIWSFFFGLILASAIWMLRGVKRLSMIDIVPIAIGIMLILAISVSPSAQFSSALPMVFLAGFIAISAMLLPGISGSFLLLLMGLYATTIEAVKSFDLMYILTFAAGAGVGFLVFSRFIYWLLSRYYRVTLLFLIGLLVGSLYVVWPWKYAGDKGAQNILPGTYADKVGDSMLALSVISFVVAMALVFSFEYFFGGTMQKNEQTPKKVQD